MNEDYSATWYPSSTSSYWPTRPDSHSHSFIYNYPLNSYIDPRGVYTDMMVQKEKELSAQEKIDEEVKAALEKPRREAEVQRRVELAAAIGTTDKYETGAVLRFKRKLGDKSYFYVVVKGSNSKWYVSGQTNVTRSGYTWDELVEWMITGTNTVEDVEVASGWNTL